MTGSAKTVAIYAAIALAGVLGPVLLPAYTTQFAFLWVMVTFALTWDVLGGQMGYNSFGNVVYFGLGMYICAVVQVAPFTDLAEYTSAYGTQDIGLTPLQYYAGLAVGCLVAAVVAVVVAAVLGSGILGLRGHYFAICTLGLGIAAGEIAAGIDIIGAGSGMVTPLSRARSARATASSTTSALCWPSPSIITRTSPLAALAPAFIAAPFPRDTGCEMTFAPDSSARAAVSSSDPSFTTRTSACG